MEEHIKIDFTCFAFMLWEATSILKCTKVPQKGNRQKRRVNIL